MAELWDNPLFPVEERLEMAKGGIDFRNKRIEQQAARIAELESAQSSQQGAVAIYQLQMLGKEWSDVDKQTFDNWRPNLKPEYSRIVYTHPHATGSEQRRDAWISVDEQLPEEGQDVVFIVHAAASSIQAHLHGRVLGGRFLTVGSYPTFTVPGLGFNASHWMPLPEAPAALSQQAKT